MAKTGITPVLDPMAPLRRFDEFQHRRRWLSLPIAVVKKFGDDQAGNLAALVAYYAFFSLFPLLLVFVTVLGFVLSGDPSALHSVKSSVLGRFPVIGSTIRAGADGQHARARDRDLASLWAGLGITQAATQAFDRVWAVPMKERPNFLTAASAASSCCSCSAGCSWSPRLRRAWSAAELGGTGALFAGIRSRCCSTSRCSSSRSSCCARPS